MEPRDEYLHMCAKGYQAIREGNYAFAAKYLYLAEQKAQEQQFDHSTVDDLKMRLESIVYKH